MEGESLPKSSPRPRRRMRSIRLVLPTLCFDPPSLLSPSRGLSLSPGHGSPRKGRATRVYRVRLVATRRVPRFLHARLGANVAEQEGWLLAALRKKAHLQAWYFGTLPTRDSARGRSLQVSRRRSQARASRPGPFPLGRVPRLRGRRSSARSAFVASERLRFCPWSRRH